MMVGPLLVSKIFAVNIGVYPKFVTDSLLPFFSQAM
jgi:hypothetical protein